MSTPLTPVASAVVATVSAMSAPAANVATPGTSGQSANARFANAAVTSTSGAVVPGGIVPGATVPSRTAPGATAAGSSAAVKPVLTAEQKAALKNLHATAQQFESLFVNMLFKTMRAAAPQTSITGEKESSAETTFTEMLDEKRSESMAETGAFGIGKILEDQLRASVLANPAQAAKARMAAPGIL